MHRTNDDRFKVPNQPIERNLIGAKTGGTPRSMLTHFYAYAVESAQPDRTGSLNVFPTCGNFDRCHNLFGTFTDH
jgi:hypothetical protein